MVPSKFVLMMASFEDSTMAADDGQYLTEEAIAIRSSVRTCEANARYNAGPSNLIPRAQYLF
jgi:hypothetical protein